MSGMYPNNQVIELFGKQVKWPGLGPDGKFTNGSFTDPLIEPSFIPAETLNLLLDNMQSVIEGAGLHPNNIEPDQLLRALQVLAGYGGIGSEGFGIDVDLPVVAFNTPFLVATAKRRLTIIAGTKIGLGTDTFIAHQDVELNIPNILYTGSIANGKDYYLHLIRGGANLDIVASLNKAAPTGLNPANVKCIGGLHTLCANVGSNLTYVEGEKTKQHPLNGFVAEDILPQSVWCLNHRPHSEPEGMVYIPTLDFWCDIYLQSGSGENTKSAYQGAITRSRQFGDHVEDMLCVRKELLSDSEFAIAMMGSNEKTSVAGTNEAAATAGGAGGRVDTTGRRMISIWGIEEGCGSISQYLRDTGPVGGSSWTTQSGNKGDIGGTVHLQIAGGYWSLSAANGSRNRNTNVTRIGMMNDHSNGGRGRSSPIRVTNI